jgi:histidinol-phosphate aminotransferase
MQTLSKAWGLAALRLGLCYTSLDIIALFNKVKPPYNINEASQELALEALQNTEQVNIWIKELVNEKVVLINQLLNFPFVEKIFQSDANFILVKVKDANNLYNYLAQNEVVVRNRSKDVLCDNCLRITIGTPLENSQLLILLKQYEQQSAN